MDMSVRKGHQPRAEHSSPPSTSPGPPADPASPPPPHELLGLMSFPGHQATQALPLPLSPTVLSSTAPQAPS